MKHWPYKLAHRVAAEDGPTQTLVLPISTTDHRGLAAKRTTAKDLAQCISGEVESAWFVDEEEKETRLQEEKEKEGSVIRGDERLESGSRWC